MEPQNPPSSKPADDTSTSSNLPSDAPTLDGGGLPASPTATHGEQNQEVADEVSAPPVPGQSFSPNSGVVPEATLQSTDVPNTLSSPVSSSIATPVSAATSQTEPLAESPDIPPQPPVLNKRIFTPPPDELLKKPSHKKRYIVLALLSIVVLGGVGAYFGYFVPNKPENMWKSALVNTGKGYDKLIEYSDKAKNTKTWSQEGTFNVDGALEADGTFKGQSDGSAGGVEGSISAMGAKVNFDVRTLPSATETPDMYFKIDGLDGLGTLVGQETPEVEAALNSLNNQWYVIDHTLFEQLEGASADPASAVTSNDVIALFKKVGVTSKEYVFTGDTEKAAVIMKEKVGRETKNDRNVYHYTVDTNDKQAEKYVTALCNDLKSSKIGQMIEDSVGENAIDCKMASEAVKGDIKLNEGDITKKKDKGSQMVVDAWVDTKTKLMHAIRFSDSKDKNNFIEISQNFTGGDEMPFKILMQDSSSSTKTNFSLDVVVNTRTQAVSTKGTFGFADPSNDENNTKGDFRFTLKPTKNQPKIEKPEGAKNIIELLNALGVGDLLSGGGLLGGTQGRANDTLHTSNMKNLQMQLEVYYSDNGFYPSLAHVNNQQWVDGQLRESATESDYGYAVRNESGNSCSGQSCQKYTLTAILSSGETYTLNSVN